jgi:hypothetical protein
MFFCKEENIHMYDNFPVARSENGSLPEVHTSIYSFLVALSKKLIPTRG